MLGLHAGLAANARDMTFAAGMVPVSGVQEGGGSSLSSVSLYPESLVGHMVLGEPLTLEEARILTPACKLIFAFQRAGQGQWYNSSKGSPLLDQPEHLIAKDAISFHHACWADVSRSRYFRATKEIKRKQYLKNAVGNYKFIIEHKDYLPPGWPFLPQMYVEMGRAKSLQNDFGGTLAAFMKALEINPSYENAYVEMVSFMQFRDMKDKALKYATEGLRRVPASKTLKKKYLALGGKEPFPEPYPSADPPSPVTADQKPLTAPVADSGARPVDPVPSQEAKPVVEDAPNQAGVPANPGKSFCRFCP
jgi:hypothetical protein